MSIWNPWHGCHKISEGCLNCYMFRRDAMYDKDSTVVTKTANFDAWRFIRERSDLHFVIITKRIHRFEVSLPDDWGDGYENVTICSTCENQRRADERIPLLLSLPIKHRKIAHEPMLEHIDIERYLESGLIEAVTCGGESGDAARPCCYDWILDIREQCRRTETSFHFHQTGANFIKCGKRYRIPRKVQMSQARKANIDIR